MSKKKHGLINEMLLFHGTGENDPYEIARGEDGLDVRLSRSGSWGNAIIYLSENSLYADRFAHHTASGEKEMMIAKALIAEAFDYGTERKRHLKFPPVKQTSVQNIVNIKFDSVAAITKDTRVYMLYDNMKTYPMYIVKYKV